MRLTGRRGTATGKSLNLMEGYREQRSLAADQFETRNLYLKIRSNFIILLLFGTFGLREQNDKDNLWRKRGACPHQR